MIKQALTKSISEKIAAKWMRNWVKSNISRNLPMPTVGQANQIQKALAYNKPFSEAANPVISNALDAFRFTDKRIGLKNPGQFDRFDALRREMYSPRDMRILSNKPELLQPRNAPLGQAMQDITQAVGNQRRAARAIADIEAAARQRGMPMPEWQMIERQVSPTEWRYFPSPNSTALGRRLAILRQIAAGQGSY